MEGILKVTPEKLTEASGEFSVLGNQMKQLTEEMIALVNSMKTIWQGEAAASYGTKFQSLQTDMDKLYRMVQEHANDLQEMSAHYQAAESGNTEEGNGLNSNVVL